MESVTPVENEVHNGPLMPASEENKVGDNLLHPKTLVKMLASSNNKTRETGLQIFLSWLPQQPQISSTDLKNLWKGLFYSIWHADKLQFQSTLIDQISSLTLSLTPDLASRYCSFFFLTMHREWSGIDLLRLNKYYLFIRRFLHHLFLFMKNRQWDLKLCGGIMGDLESGIFNYDGKFHGNGVNYHVVSVFLEELRPFLPLEESVMEVLFGPFVSVVCRSEDKVLVEKTRVGVFDALVKGGCRLLEGGGEGEMVVFGRIAKTMSFSEKFYAMGCSTQCSDINRKVVLRLHEDFVKVERDLEGVGEGALASFDGDCVMEDGGRREKVEEDNVEEENDVNPSDMEEGGEKVEEEKVEEEKDVHPTEMEEGAEKVEENNVEEMVEEEDVNPSEMEEGSKKKSKKNKGKGKNKREADEINNPNNEQKTRKKLKKCGNRGNRANRPPVGVHKDETEEVAAPERGGDCSNDVGTEEVDTAGDDEGHVSGEGIEFDEDFISNLRAEFERADAEKGGAMEVNGHVPEKRSRTKRGKDGPTKVSKKGVTFAMRNNIVWKPHDPLPPESVRIPPSLTPRGSALKKGVPAGPIGPSGRTGVRIQPAKKKKKKKMKTKGVMVF